MDSEREKREAVERASQRKQDYLRSYHFRLTVGGMLLILGICVLLYYAGDFINSYVNLAWIGLTGILISAFFTGKYLYLICLTDDDDY